MPILLDDFSGGLNTRDSPNALSLAETPAALNFTLDERGALRLRKGCLNAVALPGTAGTAPAIFYSKALDQWLCARYVSAVATKLFTRPGDLSGAWTDRGALSTNTDQGLTTCFVDFPGTTPQVVIASSNTTFGVWTWDGTTLTQRTTTARGRAMALWQNRIWLAAGLVSGETQRLWFSAVGDPTSWGSFVDIREQDAAPLTNLGIAGGALLLFKNGSAYRVNDSSSGAYTTIDPSAGCIGIRGLATLRGHLYTWSADGLYEWDGIGKGRSIGDKIRPLLAANPATVGFLPGIAAGASEDRVVWAYPDTPGGENVHLIEYDPSQKWIMRHDLPAAAQNNIAHFARKDATLYAAVQDGDALFKMFTETPGSDAGTVYAGSYRTPWLQPNRGRLARILRAQVQGLLLTGGTNTLTVKVYKDWDLSTSDSYDVSADLRGGDAQDQQEGTILRSLGHSRAFALEFVTGTAAGDAAVRSLDLEAVALDR